MSISHRFMFSAASVIGSLWLCSSVAFAQTVPLERTISVQGSATMMVQPNQLEFSVSIEQRGADTKALQKTVQKTVQNIVYLLQQNGINDRNIQSMQMSLQPHYEYDDGKRTQKDFILGRTIHVKHGDFAVYSKLMQDLIEAGATSISPARLTHDNPEKQYLEALKLAVKDAQKRASTMLEPLNASVGNVLTITEQSTHRPVAHRAKSMLMNAENIDLPGEQGIAARVSVTFTVK